MPREIVHWEVLDAAATELEARGAVSAARLLERHRWIARLGAIVMDAPYYDRFGRGPFSEVAARLHGVHGEDTLETPRALLRQALAARGEEREALLAFLVGLESHRATDIAFHPAVFWFTGNVYASDREESVPALRDHNAFEVHLDSWWRARLMDGGSWSLRISTLLDEVAPRRPLVVQAMEKAAPAPPEASWDDAISDYARFQRILRSRVLGGLIHLADRIDGNNFVLLESLVSWGRRKPVAFFDEPFSYRHPITGEEERVSVLELRERAVAATVEAAERLAPFVENEDPEASAGLPASPGAPLSSGLVGEPASAMHHFSDSRPPFLRSG